MPRKLVEKSETFPYHIYARSNNRDWFEVNLEIIFKIYSEVLNKTIEMYGFNIHSFVLMSNHFHMLLSTPQANISEGMRYFMTETSRKIARESKRINRIYGARYGSCIIKTSDYYYYAYKYIYRNPIEAKLCKNIEDYNWSTLNTKTIKVSVNTNGFDEYIPKNKLELLSWLNDKPQQDIIDGVAKALNKKEFKFTRNKKTGKMPKNELS